MPFLPWNAVHQPLTLPISWSVFWGLTMVFAAMLFVLYQEWALWRLRQQFNGFKKELEAATKGAADDRRPDTNFQGGRVSVAGFRVLDGGKHCTVAESDQDRSVIVGSEQRAAQIANRKHPYHEPSRKNG